MTHDGLQPILLLLVTAIASVTLAMRLNLSPLIGYFMAGAIVGPYGFHWLDTHGSLALLAEIGVAFLLFDIGIHLSFRALWEARRELFGLGPAQMLVTSLLLGGVAYAFFQDAILAILLGVGFCLSSTAVVAQGLQTTQEDTTPLGRAAMAILIGQDILVVFLLLLLPTLGQGQTDLGWVLLQSVSRVILALALVVVFSRVLLRPLFEWITATRNDELFTAAALLFVLSFAWGVQEMGLSMPLGAFLAGLALSESDFCYLVKAEIHPFRGLLLGLFFITVGMSLNWSLLLTQWPWVLGVALGLMGIKALALWGVARCVGYCQGFSLRLGLMLCQASEFVFVLFALAVSQGLLDASLSQPLQLAVGLTLALTPVANTLARRWAAQLKVPDAPIDTTGQRVIITGFDAIGQGLAKMLTAEGIPYVAYESDHNIIAHYRSEGYQVEYSDINRPRTASAVSQQQARAVVILLDNPNLTEHLANALVTMNPALPIYVATDHLPLINQLAGLPLKDVLMKNDETLFEIADSLFATLGVSPTQIQHRIERFRKDTAPVIPLTAT
jgi:Kef-type K+ transport system membrane component KefB/voltage-gated potassium channel Kch